MTFILELELDTPSMSSWQRIRRALQTVKVEINGPGLLPKNPVLGDSGIIYDNKGHRSGQWEVVE